MDQIIGNRNFSPRFNNSVVTVTVTTDRAVCRGEKRLQMIGAKSAPPAMEATLRTKSTMPPSLGIHRASPTVAAPKIRVNNLAIKISSRSPAVLRKALRYRSVANTVAARLMVVFALLEVADIMPASTRPMRPGGNTCLHSIMYAPSTPSPFRSGFRTR